MSYSKFPLSRQNFKSSDLVDYNNIKFYAKHLLNNNLIIELNKYYFEFNEFINSF